MSNTFLNQKSKTLAAKIQQKFESEGIFKINNENIWSSFYENLDNNIIYNEQYLNNSDIRLRGGGCGKSKIQKNIDSQQKNDENQQKQVQLPENYISNLTECLKFITEQATLIGDSNKRNEVIKKIQWFLYNREYLNNFCIDEKAGKKIYDLMTADFAQLLEVLIIYLRNSGFICYQILQICNELLRSIYSLLLKNSGRFFEEQVKQGYLQKLQEFDIQLEIEQAHVWKTGIEFEVKIMKIMIMNSQTNTTEGQDLLIDTFKEVAKSIISLSPSEDLLSKIIDGGKYLLKKGIEKKLYPKETYETYYLFQMIKWSIIKQLKSQFSVYKQIQKLKDIFSQYIVISDNWIIHFSWIQIITDIIGYRPIIDKSILEMQIKGFSLNKWNLLIENNLIRCVSYNKNEAIMYLFDQERKFHDIELTSILNNEGKQKFLLFSQFLLKGDLIQNVNIWDYYKEFSFKKQENKKQKDYEIILASQEQEILQNLIYNLKSEKDEVVQIYEGIIQSFSNYPQEFDQIFISIFKDDQEASQKQFLEALKKLILLSYKIQELSYFEASKLDILQPYQEQFKNQGNLDDIKGKIDIFVNSEIKVFINSLLDYFLIFIQFLSTAQSKSVFFDTKNEVNQDNNINLLEVDNFQKIFSTFEAQFDQFSFNLIQYKTNFLKYIGENKKEISQKISAQNIISTFKSNCNGELIDNIIKKLQSEIYQNNLQLYNSQLKTLDDAKQNLIQCKFIIMILKFLKQFSNIQQKYVQLIYNQLLNYTKKNEKQIEFKDEIQKQNITSVLTQQQLKISQLKSQTINESDQTFQLCCNSLLSQIQSDFFVIKNDGGKFKTSILEFFTDVQFQILQMVNQIQDISTFQIKIGETLQSLFDKYEEFIKTIQPSGEQNPQDEENKQDFKKIPQIFLNQYPNSNNKLILDIKKTRKYFKQYEKMLILQIDLLNQPNELQDQPNELQDQPNKLSVQTDKLKYFQEKRRDVFFSDEVKTKIKELIINLSNYYKQKQQQEQQLELEQEQGQKEDGLELMEYLSFFYQLSNSDYFNKMKADKINDSIWQDIKNAYQKKKEKLLDLINLKPDHKIREGLVYNLIRLQFSIQEQQINSFSTKYLQYMWVYEKDQKVRNLLKNKELIEIQKQLFAQDLDNLSGSIKDELKEKMIRLENLQQRIKLEGNQQKRDQLQIELRKTYDELDESLDNISEMSEAMNISLIFLKDIQKDVKQIKTQIDKLQDSINQVTDDVRKLRGKNYKELLEIRKQKILFQSKLTDVDSVYIQLKTIEYDPFSGGIINNDKKEKTQLIQDQWNNFKGEINEFIWCDEQIKDVMLLSGFAGSGKSKAARKIEEFLWKQKEIDSRWTPIFVSLPSIKNPKYNLLDQALESENYQFDKYQIREFKEAIQAKKEFIILILDSYDEMKQDCIQQNLIMTNKLFQDLTIDQKVDRQMKVIITTRKEILNIQGYQTWFYGESLQTLKEVELQNFDEEQQNEYLNQYVELSVKRKIKDIYDFVKQISGQNFDLEEFINIWSLISEQVKNSIQKSESMKQEGIFQNKEEEIIIGKIKTHKILSVLSEEQTIGLKKELLALWSAIKFKQSIANVKIEDLLTTPFMLEIVVQVLPNITKRYLGSTAVKESFIKNYLKLKKYIRQSQFEIEKYRKENQNQFDSQNQCNLDDNDKTEKELKDYLEIDQAKINEIVDSLENLKFFQNYSIVSVLKNKGSFFTFDDNIINLNPDDIKIVLMALKMKKFTIFEFYESFINFYHEQQIQKQREIGKITNYENFASDIYQFSYSLAVDMTYRDLSQIGYKPQGKLNLESNYKIEEAVEDWLKQYFDVEDEYKKLIRSSILLSVKGSKFSFTHKSIQEFYVAKYIFDILSSLRNSDQFDDDQCLIRNKQILQKSLFNQTKFNISTNNYRGAINFIKEKLIQVENLNQKLIKIVKLSAINKDYKYSASNSIYLLKQMKVYLGSQDFNKIHLANTNISGLSFFDCNLSESTFENVEINSCNFSLADLSNANWQNVICKEKPFLAGHKQSVLEVQFSPDGKYIASAGKEKQIKIWDAQTYEHCSDLDKHTAQVNTLSFSSDSKFIYSGSDDKTIIKWDITNLQDIKSNKVVELKDEDSKKLYVQGIYDFLVLDLSKDSKSDECIITITNGYYEKFSIHPTQPIIAIQNKDSLKIDLFNYINLNFVKPLDISDQFIYDYQARQIEYIVFSNDGNLLAFGTSRIVYVWDMAQNKITSILNFPDIFIKNILIDQDNRKLILDASKQIFIRDINQFQMQSQEKKQICFEVKISPQGRIIVIVYEKKLSIIDILQEQQINTIQFDLQPNQLQFSKDGTKISFFLNDDQVIQQFQILEVFTVTIICQLHWNAKCWKNHIISNNFEKLFIMHKEKAFYKTIRINTNKIHKAPQIKTFELQIRKFCVKANSWIIAYFTNEKNSIIIYDLNQNQKISQPIENEDQQILDFQFSPCENLLAVGYNQNILIWNLDQNPFEIQDTISFNDEILKSMNLQETISMNDIILESMNYSPDGQQIGLVFSKTIILIYNVKQKKLQKVFETNQFKFQQIQFSLDNNIIGLLQDHSIENITILSKNNNYEKLLGGDLSKYKNYNQELEKYVYLKQIIFTQDSKSLITISSEYLILWNLSTQEITDRKKTYLITQKATFSYNRNLIALIGNQVLELWMESQNKFIFIGSQVFDIYIEDINFIFDDKHMLLQEDSQLILFDLDFLQAEQTYSKDFTCGAISSNDLIAFVENKMYEHYLCIYNNELEEITNSQFKIYYGAIQLQFFEHKINFLLIRYQDKMQIWDYINKTIMSSFNLYSMLSIQLCLKDQILIEQNQKSVYIWDFEDLKKSKLLGYHENVNCFSIQENGEIGVALKEQKEIIIKDIFNIVFAFPEDENKIIQELFLSVKEKQFIFSSNQNELFIFDIDKKQLHQYTGMVNAIGFCQEKNYILIQQESKIELVEFTENKFKISDTFDFEEKITNCSIKFTSNGEGLSLSSNNMIRLFQITKDKKIICIYRYQIFNENPKLKQVEIFLEQDRKQQQYLAILDQSSFQIFKYKEQNQIVKIVLSQYNSKQGVDLIDLLENKNFNQEKYKEYISREKFKNVTDVDHGDCCFIYLPQNQWFAISTLKNNIHFWDQKAKKIVGTLKGHKEKINFMSVSHDGKFLASASDDKLIKLWSINQNESSEMQQAHSQEITAIQFSQDGQFVASASGQQIFLWDFIDKRFMSQLEGHKKDVCCLEFSQCNRYLISGSQDGTIIFWDIQYPKAAELIYIIDKFVFPLDSISFSPKNQSLVALCEYKLLKWNLDNIEQQENDRTITLNSGSESYSFISDDEFIYFDKQLNSLTILNYKTTKSIMLNWILDIKQIITSKNICLILDKNGNLFKIEKENNKWQRSWVFCSQSINIFLSPNGQFLYQVSDCTTNLDVYENRKTFQTTLHNFEKLKDFKYMFQYEFDRFEVKKVVFSSDLTQAILTKKDKVEIYETKDWKIKKEYNGCKFPEQPQITKDKQYLACSSANDKYSIYVWEINYQTNTTNFEIQKPKILTVKISESNENKEQELIIFKVSSQDSNKIYALYKDCTIRDWNIKNASHEILNTLPDTFQINQLLDTFLCKQLIQFSENLQYVMYPNDTCNLIYIFNIQNQENSQEIFVGNNFNRFAFCQNKDIFAISISSGIQLIKDKEQSQISLFNEDELKFYDQTGLVTSICFSHDDQEIVFCHNKNIYIYKINENLETQILGCWNVSDYYYQQIFNSSESKLEFMFVDQNEISSIKLNPSILQIEILKRTDLNCQFACFSPDNKYMAKLISSLQIQEMQNLQKIHQVNYQGNLLQFQSKEILVIAENEKLMFINISKIDEDKTFIVKEYAFIDQITRIALTSKCLLILLKRNYYDKYHVIFDFIDNLEERLFKAFYHSDQFPVFSENGNWFALGNKQYNQIILININKIQQERCRDMPGNIISKRIIYSQDGNFLIFLQCDQIFLLNSQSLKVVKQISIDSFNWIQFNISSQYFTLQSNSELRFYQLSNEQNFILFKNFNEIQIIDKLCSFELSPKGDFLLTGEQCDQVNSITLWKVDSNQNICEKLQTNNQINAKVLFIKFNPDRINFVAGLEDGSVNLYQINIQKTNYLKKQPQESMYQIVCYQTFAKYSALNTQKCIVSQETNISSENKTINKLFT
ncbi:unnamed protein product [Paramecium sonneborni]|uniref:NACHT domain-containing protein n=1 Tax=Paramecium sonneborni TaxID=65129 RepID=A0A8S1QA90_9CILI|nr:unnamed protein product [Paramecium sonneborni]